MNQKQVDKAFEDFKSVGLGGNFVNILALIKMIESFAATHPALVVQIIAILQGLVVAAKPPVQTKPTS